MKWAIYITLLDEDDLTLWIKAKAKSQLEHGYAIKSVPCKAAPQVSMNCQENGLNTTLKQCLRKDFYMQLVSVISNIRLLKNQINLLPSYNSGF